MALHLDFALVCNMVFVLFIVWFSYFINTFLFLLEILF